MMLELAIWGVGTILGGGTAIPFLLEPVTSGATTAHRGSCNSDGGRRCQELRPSRGEVQPLNGGATTAYGGAATVATVEHGVLLQPSSVASQPTTRVAGEHGDEDEQGDAGGLGTSEASRVAAARRRQDFCGKGEALLSLPFLCLFYVRQMRFKEEERELCSGWLG